MRHPAFQSDHGSVCPVATCSVSSEFPAPQLLAGILGTGAEEKRRARQKGGEEGGSWGLPREDPVSLCFQLQQKGGGGAKDELRKEGA